MQKVYQRINWENEPSENTPLNESNLNRMDYALNEIDNRVVKLSGYETRAYESAQSAATSATNADASADSAEDSAALSRLWAVGPSGSGQDAPSDTNNAYFWAKAAEGAAAGGVSSFKGRSGIVIPEAGDYRAEQISYGTDSNVRIEIDKLKQNGIKLADVANVSSTLVKKTVTFKWTDPDDVIVGGYTLAKWAGTKLVMKAGSVPTSPDDGTVILDNTIKNQYATTGFEKTGLEYNTTYYFKFFPYSTLDNYTYGTAVNLTPVRIPIPIPTFTQTLTYNTTEQIPTFNNYDVNFMALSGDSVGTNAGTYTAIFTLTDDDHMWSDSTTSDKEVVWSIGKMKLTKPSVSGTYTYTGAMQTVTVLNMNDAYITATGTTATSAGTHIATFSLKDNVNTSWSDDTVSDVTAQWVIGIKKIVIPSVSGTYTYNGNEQTVTVVNLDSDYVTASGITGTNAGTYTATFSLKDTSNTTWSDDTIVDKTATWSIGKASASLVLSDNSVTLDSLHLTATVTVSNDFGRTISVSSSDTSVATATVTITTVNISHVNKTKGTATITVTAASNTNYESATATISVTADFVKIVTWAAGTNAEIKEMLDAHYAGEINVQDYWNVGDERTFTFSNSIKSIGGENWQPSQTVKFVLLDKGGEILENGAKCAFVIGQKNALSANTGWNASPYNTNWANSYLEPILNSRGSATGGNIGESTNGYYSALAVMDSSNVAFNEILKSFRCPVKSSLIEKVSLASTDGITSGNSYEYYSASSNRIKKLGETGSAAAWWTCKTTGTSSTTATIEYITASGSRSSLRVSASVGTQYGVAPIMCI